MNANMSFRVKNARGFAMGGWFLRRMLPMFLLATVSGLVFGQVNQLETDKGIAASIAPYSADVREAILQASQYPQILTQIQQNQSQTQASFQKMIGDFRQTKQGWFYTLTRYPDLMHTLANLPDGQDKDAVYKLLPNQNSDLQEAAWKLYRNNKTDLVRVDNIKMSAQQDFDKAIQNLDNPAKAAFQKLSNLPDVLTLLTNNIDLTARLGEQYKDNAQQLDNQLAALHDSLNVQNQYEIAAFKKQMVENPEAMQELSQAAKDYASSNGYNIPTQQAQQNNDWNNPNYFANPYSYWFGYPTWYASPLWYPGAFWYDFGLYGGLGSYGLYGFPSFGFAYWFFNAGYYQHYPHLYRQFGNYYRTSVAGNRILGSVNGGFMAVANNHFSPNGSNRLNYLTTPSAYSRPSGFANQNAVNATHFNANTYHAQSWGGFSGGRGFAHGGGRH